jgi:FkbM family methyltransferase
MPSRTDGPDTDGLRHSVAASAHWIAKLALATVRPRKANFILLSPPFSRRQKVLDRRARVIRTFSIRNAADYGTLARIFGDEAYRLDRLDRGADLVAAHDRILASRAKPLILDCGTDSGLSTRYFADAFPNARVIGIEPNHQTFLHARANCGSDNIELREAAISSECRCGAAGAEPHTQRATCADAPRAVDLLSINSLVAEQCAAGGWPFIIKLDLDQFEDELFSRNSEWVDEFPLLIIKLRKWRLPSRRRSQHLLRRLADADRDFVFLGENLFSIANDEATTARRQTYVDMAPDVAPYHVREAT